MTRWLAHWLGLDNPSGPIYLFWSGAGGRILPSVAILAAAWHAVNCHEPGCKRPGYRITAGPDGIHRRHCARHHHQYHQPKENTAP